MQTCGSCSDFASFIVDNKSVGNTPRSAESAASRPLSPHPWQGPDWKFIKTYVPHSKSTQDIVIKLKSGGGARSADIVQHRLTHPRAKHTLCMKHKKLFKRSLDDTKNQDWDASLDTFPIQDIIRDVSTFTARRYVCDRDCHLTKIFRKYDIILVDEKQDLSSSQELRLIQHMPRKPCALYMWSFLKGIGITQN